MTARSMPAATPSDLFAHLEKLGIRTETFELRLFSTIMTLGTPRDVTLQELRIETFFPADAASEAAWRAVIGDPAGRGRAS